MNFLYRIRDALCRFMYGRNGTDALGWATLVAVLALNILTRCTHGIASALLGFLAIACSILLLFRLFSRNLTRRREENAQFMRWLIPKQNALRAARERNADKEHKYIRCSCGAYCRVPRNVGKIEMTCPKCGGKRIVKT